MFDQPDPLEHVPDPSKRYQVFGFVRGGIAFIEILDDETKTGFVLDVLTALEVARDITDHAVRVLTEIGELAQGMIDPDSLDKDDDRWQKDVWRREQD